MYCTRKLELKSEKIIKCSMSQEGLNSDKKVPGMWCSLICTYPCDVLNKVKHCELQWSLNMFNNSGSDPL